MEISIHSLRMEGDGNCCDCAVRINSISIHSLRMEGDDLCGFSSVQIGNFNPLPPHGGRPCQATDGLLPKIISIHSLRMEGDRCKSPTRTATLLFQSTPSAWRETGSQSARCRKRANFNPLPPHGGRRASTTLVILRKNISIHSLRMEGDGRFFRNHSLSTAISIHSLRMEGDNKQSVVTPK